MSVTMSVGGYTLVEAEKLREKAVTTISDKQLIGKTRHVLMKAKEHQQPSFTKMGGVSIKSDKPYGVREAEDFIVTVDGIGTVFEWSLDSSIARFKDGAWVAVLEEMYNHVIAVDSAIRRKRDIELIENIVDSFSPLP